MIFMIFMMSTTMTFANGIAKENMTSAEFLAGSNAEGEITLTEDITLSDALKVDAKNYTVDLNNHTLMLTKDTNLFVNNANVTFKNGSIKIEGIKGSADCILGVGHYGSSANLTLNNVKLEASNYTSPYALIFVYNESTLNIENNSVLNAKNEQSSSGGVIKTSNGKVGKINITDSTLNFENVERGFVDGVINIKNSAVTMTGLDNGINNSDLTVDNSTLTISDCIGRALTINGTNVNVKNGSVLDFSKSLEGDILFKSEGKINIDKSSELNFETVKTFDGAKLNELIESEKYDYEVDAEGNIIKVCNHSNDFIIINTKDATCTEEGYTGDKVCPDCNEVMEEGTIIPKLSHEFEDGICNNCGELDPNYNTGTEEEPGTEEKPNTENNSDNGVDSPQTSDDTNLYFMVGMIIFSIIGLACIRKTRSVQ